jgi:uncharacterized protein (DUF3820 family)
MSKSSFDSFNEQLLRTLAEFVIPLEKYTGRLHLMDLASNYFGRNTNKAEGFESCRYGCNKRLC